MQVVPIQQALDLGETKFEDFWLLWLKKVKRKEASKLFARLRDEQKMAALVGAAEWRSVWLGWDENYWPNAVNWIEGERWEDELPKQHRAQAHVPVKPREDTPKSVMPEHVRQLIAQLRNK
jgi:hypothetical protein